MARTVLGANNLLHVAEEEHIVPRGLLYPSLEDIFLLVHENPPNRFRNDFHSDGWDEKYCKYSTKLHPSRDLREN